MLSSFHNPDILTCLANLSSDEVFTPPNVANQMLDTLPKELWSDKTVTFLDPVSKTGVFLREITKRLLSGLETEIPDIEERLEHILKNQVFGIGITRLTSEISRRTLYCSKKANGEYSIVNFDDDEGNLRYFESQHFFADGVKCRYCGANKKLYQRDKGLESYAYSFIHEEKLKELFNMKFDVIIGNPPYQMTDGGHGSSATPLYDKFIETAKKLKPRFITMIVPSRWFAGGRGLDSFRKSMLNDKSLKELHDFPNSSDCFPGVEIKGGVNYFLWDKDYQGDCIINTYDGKNIISNAKRPLLLEGTDIFIRQNEGLDILKKVLFFKENSFSKLVSNNDPFGFDVRQKNSMKREKPVFSLEKFKGSVNFYYFTWHKLGLGYINNENITKNKELITKHKIFITQNYGAGEGYPHQIINKPFIPHLNSCCTETYLSIGPFENEEISKNVLSYIETKFFRFLVMLKKNTQGAYKKVYEFVPAQDFFKKWTDEELYKKYSLTEVEIETIENMIKPME